MQDIILGSAAHLCQSSAKDTAEPMTAFSPITVCDHSERMRPLLTSSFAFASFFFRSPSEEPKFVQRCNAGGAESTFACF